MSNDEASVLAKTIIFDDEQSLTPSAITATTAGLDGPTDITKLYLPAHNRSSIVASDSSKKKKRHSNGGYYTHLAPTPPQDDFTTTSATVVTTRGDDPSSSELTKMYSVISDQSVIKASEQMFAVSNPKLVARSNMVLEQVQETPYPHSSHTVSRKKKLCISPPRKWVIALSFFLSLVGFTGAIILLVVLVLKKGDGSTNNSATNEQNFSSVINIISSYYSEHSTDYNSIFENTSTAQYKAAKWLVDNHILDNFSLHAPYSSADQILQFYVLAVIYHATNGNEWTNGCNFFASNSVCSWSGRSSNSSIMKGVTSCSDDGKITGLSLGMRYYIPF